MCSSLVRGQQVKKEVDDLGDDRQSADVCRHFLLHLKQSPSAELRRALEAEIVEAHDWGDEVDFPQNGHDDHIEE